MKKIMFNDKYGLTKAVLDGRKTMTRRIIKGLVPAIKDLRINDNGVCEALFGNRWMISPVQPKYKIGERIAIAQAYKDICDNPYFLNQCAANGDCRGTMVAKEGWGNKMYVSSFYMPWGIEIAGIKAERMQDISDEDCLKEGIIKDKFNDFPNEMYYPYKGCNDKDVKYFAKSAFAALIDKVSGKGIWMSNPFVYAYDYKLIKL